MRVRDIQKISQDDLANKREGWALFTLDDGTIAIQRLDDPQSCGDDFPEEPVFKNDLAAIRFVSRQAKKGSARHKRAMRFHGKIY